MRQFIRRHISVFPFCIFHSKRLPDILFDIILVAFTRNNTHDLPQQGKTQVAVFKLDPRRVGKVDLLTDEIHKVFIRIRQLPVAPGIVFRETGAMREQVTDRDRRRVRRGIFQVF